MEDWRSAVSKLSPIIRPIVSSYLQELFDRYGERILSVVLFGSFARGDFGPNSDIDLLLVIREFKWGEPLSFHSTDKLVLTQWKTCRHYHKVTPYPLTPEQALLHRPIYLDMLEEGLILYDRGGFIGGIFEEMRQKLKRLGAKRCKLPSGSKYWILKPDLKFGEIFEI